MTDDLVTRLRQLSRAEHDDLDICDEAAEEIINLRVDVYVLREMLEKYKRDAIEAALQSQATEAYPCRIVETNFETSTVTLEMQGKYTVSSGQKYLCDVPLYKCPEFSCKGLLDSSNAPFTPKNASEMRSFIGMNFDSLQYANPETEEPHEMDRYSLTIHDLLSAFDWAGHYDCDHFASVRNMVAPDGWQLVPKTPTHNMVDNAHNCDSYFEVQDIYKAMLAAAPKYTGDK